jgi:hypothetical protein
VVGTERHHGLEKCQKLPGETVYTITVKKLGGIAKVLCNHQCNVRVRLDEESFSKALKGVQSGEDVHSKVVDQRIILVITVHDLLLEAVRVGFEPAHITVEMKHATWKESPAAQLAGGVGDAGGRGAGTDREMLQVSCGPAGSGSNSTFFFGLEQRPTQPPLTWRVHTVSSGGLGWGGFVTKEMNVPFKEGQGSAKHSDTMW